MNVKISLLATALLGAALASSGFAQDTGGDDTRRAQARGQGDVAQAQQAGPRGIQRRGPRGFRPGRVVRRLDSDGDGLISFDEFSTAGLPDVDRTFERLDRDGDGRIGGDELERPRRQRDRPNRPGRPQIDRDALAACLSEAVPGFEPRAPGNPLERADTDGDGFIDLAELSAALDERAQARFNRLDADGDRLVTEAELRAERQDQRELRRAQRDCMRELRLAAAQQP